jgi:hypothetical protein
MGLDYEIFKLGNVRLQRGGTLPDCKLAYKAFGKISAAKDNVILYPTWYSGQHYDNEWLIGSGMALDPEKYFIIIPNMLGNGLSSSPSNMPAPYNGPFAPSMSRWPAKSAARDGSPLRCDLRTAALCGPQAGDHPAFDIFRCIGCGVVSWIAQEAE